MIARPRTNGYSSREQSYMTTSSRSFISYSTAASYNGLWQSSGFRQNLGKLSKSDSWNSTPAKSKCSTFPGNHIWDLMLQLLQETPSPYSPTQNKSKIVSMLNSTIVSSNWRWWLPPCVRKYRPWQNLSNRTIVIDRIRLTTMGERGKTLKAHHIKKNQPVKASTLHSAFEEGSKETVPLNDNHHTAWDDFSTESTNVWFW